MNAALCIIQRAYRLKVKPTAPLAFVKMGHKGKRRILYVTGSLVASLLQKAAKSVYKISNPADLAKFSTHSFRFGACVLLHEKICFHPLSKKDFAGVLTAGKIISVTHLVWLMPTPMQLNNLFWRRLNNHLRPIYLTCRQFLWLLLGFSFPPMLLVRVISDLPSDLYRVYHYFSFLCTSHS